MILNILPPWVPLGNVLYLSYIILPPSRAGLQLVYRWVSHVLFKSSLTKIHSQACFQICFAKLSSNLFPHILPYFVVASRTCFPNLLLSRFAVEI